MFKKYKCETMASNTHQQQFSNQNVRFFFLQLNIYSNLEYSLTSLVHTAYFALLLLIVSDTLWHVDLILIHNEEQCHTCDGERSFPLPAVTAS